MINRLKKQAKLVFGHIEKSLAEKGVSVRPAALEHLAGFAPKELKHFAVEISEKMRDPFFFWSGIKVKEINENSILFSIENPKGEASGLIAAGERAVGLLLDKHLPPGSSYRNFQNVIFEAYDDLKNVPCQLFADWSLDEIESSLNHLLKDGKVAVDFVVLVLDEKQKHRARIFYSVHLKHTPLLT